MEAQVPDAATRMKLRQLPQGNNIRDALFRDIVERLGADHYRRLNPPEIEPVSISSFAL